ncbi:hypothetical protein SAMN06265222_109101 [Neorhodopirellula lusitana]|uniref:Uncharacterized protein n=1 Tax=Neorhodopirellula lusitana TaxID=445327 RepID=A0ABY1QE00_9BACT|nr:hypothetical protein SAMN06265222_109101 [Neorhodopirellula lusitana]
MSLGVFEHRPKSLPPHPPVSIAVLLVVEDAIKVAWSIIRQLPANEFDLASADEDTITQKLHEVLIDELFDTGTVPGFNGDLIAKGTREEKLRSFNSKHLDKMPDLIFGVIGRDVYMRTQDGIFIECKPVDASHTAGVHCCDKGITRFVRGDYAWCMLSAMMVGYAADGYTIVPKLTDALRKSTTITTRVAPTKCSQSRPVLFSQGAHVSVHERNFSYVETGDPAPDIMLRHIWLNRS